MAPDIRQRFCSISAFSIWKRFLAFAL